MKKLRDGFTTGSCAAAAALASATYHMTGECPHTVEIMTPAGVVFRPEIIEFENGLCGVIKDGGDDPDETNGCTVCANVDIYASDGDILFSAGEGVGTITRRGLKLPVGEAAINPIPRRMIETAVRSVIGNKGAKVTVSVPNGERIAERTFNGRLGVVGGISILGTTGIVRPMSEEAIKESLRLELSVCRENYGRECALVTGYSGERLIKEQLSFKCPVVLCSNYLGFLLDSAEDMGFEKITIAGGCGKLIKPAANIMYLHSHTAGGQREIVCTHAALCGVKKQDIKRLYDTVTTQAALDILDEIGVKSEVMRSIAMSAIENCRKRVHGKINIDMIMTDSMGSILFDSRIADKKASNTEVE